MADGSVIDFGKATIKAKKVIGNAALTSKPEIAALTAIATADGSDADTTQTLANAIKAKVNLIIAALKA